jgi:PAP2 superfamily
MKKIFLFVALYSILQASCKKDDHFPSQPKTDSRLITDWIGVQLQVIRNTTGVTHIAFSRHFSYTGVALYESLVKAAPHYKSIASKLNGNLSIPVAANSNSIFYPAAANTAVADMLRFFYTGKTPNLQSVDSLEQAWFTRFDTELKNKFDMHASVAFGKQVAASVIEWSKQDKSGEANIPYTLQGEGYWEPTPPANAGANLPGWGNNKTILPGTTNGAMPVAPLAFSKDQGTPFYNMVKEVYDVSQSLTQEQKDIAFFWDDAPNGKYVSVFGHWFSILKQVLEKEKTPLMKGAEAYLRLGVSMNDATISCWQSKYAYHTIRPVTYIRKYMGQSGWSSLIGTPPHPEYSSAHSTISGSGAYALESVFGKKYFFTDRTYVSIGLNPRSFAGFEEAAKEAGLSRLYAGIHYRPTVEIGNIQGKKVGVNVFNILRTH